MKYKIIDNFLSPEDFKQVQKAAFMHDFEEVKHGADVAYKLDTGLLYKTTRKYWNVEKEGDFSPFFARMRQEQDLPTDEFSLMVHSYESGAEISWHRDYSSLGAYSFYIHDEWRPEWGGSLMLADAETEDKHGNNLTVFEHRQDIMDPGYGTFILPKPNRIVFIYDGLHKVERCRNRRISFTGFFK